jgi:hypothetical protein
LTKIRLGTFHRKGSASFPGDQAEVEPLLVGMSRDPAEALGERLGVAMGASGLILVQPRIGFQLESVHSMLDFSLIDDRRE